MTSPATAKIRDDALDPQRWRVLIVLLVASLIDVIDVTIVNIAMPSIRRDTGASYSALQWIGAGYALTFAVGLITGGRLGDILGRKRVFLTGIAMFTLASLLCALAPGPELLVPARVLQGAGAALMIPQVLSIIHVSFSDAERPKVFGIFGSVIGLGAVIGPVVGALLIQSDVFGLGWRVVFLINVPLGLGGLVVGSRLLRESRSPQALRLDPIGIVLVTLALVMLMLPLTEGNVMNPKLAGLSMLLSLPVFALFAWYEGVKARRDNSPLLDRSLFRITSFRAGAGVQLTVSLASGVFIIGWTLYLQLGLDWSPLKAGLTGLPYALATTFAAIVAMQTLAGRGRVVLQAGAIIEALGALLYAATTAHFGAGITPWEMIPALAVMGGGMGLIIAPLTNSILSQVPPAHAGSASGLINTLNQLGLALGLAVASVAFFTVVENAPPGQSDAVTFGSAFQNSLWWVVGTLVIACLLMLALPRFTPASAAMPAPVADLVEEPVGGSAEEPT